MRGGTRRYHARTRARTHAPRDTRWNDGRVNDWWGAIIVDALFNEKIVSCFKGDPHHPPRIVFLVVVLV